MVQADHFCYNPMQWRNSMKFKFSGSVHYANGDPISNVVVRIFDKDDSGRGDDDLTVDAGLSDEQGRFSLSYEALRYLDFHTIHLPESTNKAAGSQANQLGIRIPDLGDVYLPYLKFNFTINGLSQEHSASLGVFQTEFHLPVNPAVEFLPSINGFKFPNNFSGYFLPYSTPAFLSSRKISSKYGLCGGMCAAAYDFLLAGRAIPQDIEVPHQGTRLQRYLFRRQMDSLGGIGQQASKVAQWTSLPDETLVGTMRRTADEFSQLRLKLDQGNLVILALIYEHATSLKGLSRLIFNNHQVLAWAFQQDASKEVTIRIYDPDLPGRDDVVIRSKPVVLGEEDSHLGRQTVLGFKSTQLRGGEFYRDVRGFFEMPYSPIRPPKGM
jgi:hypothetical protein